MFTSFILIGPAVRVSIMQHSSFCSINLLIKCSQNTVYTYSDLTDNPMMSMFLKIISSTYQA